MSTVELVLAPEPSALAATWLLAVAGLLGLAGWQLPVPPAGSLAVTLGVLLWLTAAWRRHVRAGGPVRAVRYAMGEGWWLEGRQHSGPARLVSAVVWPPVVVLRLSQGRRVTTLWLVPGRVERSALRRLRAVLRLGGVEPVVTQG